MAEPYLGEVRMVGFNFAPRNYAMCNGQLLSISQNTALFSLLGTTYGGNGVNTFGLPNLQGRTPMHVGGGLVLGEAGGEANHTLIVAEMATHTHAARGNSGDGNATTPVGNVWAPVPASASINAYNNAAPNGTMNPAAVGTAGGSQGHSNMQPYLVITFVIALQGVYPSRN